MGAGLLVLLGGIETSTLPVMAGLVPLMTLLCLTLAAVVVIFGFAAFANERRYQRIIRGHR